MDISGRIIYVIITLINFIIHSTLSAKLRCYKSNFTDYEEFPLNQPEPLINSSNPCMDRSLCSFIFAFGYMGNPYGFAVSTLMPTLINQRTCNVLLVNWEKEAGEGNFGPILGYPLHAVPDVKKVGKDLGDSIMTMVDLGLSKDIHLIGHSLGAHLVCYAGRETIKAGYTIPWLTALDPARMEYEPPLFTDPVDQTCAAFVDSVHCDPGGYGMNSAVGHVDFWPNNGNYQNGIRRQPGCNRSKSVMDYAVNGNLCSHNRCIELYNVTFAERMILEGEEAPSYQEWEMAEEDDDAETNFIGLLVDKTKKGSFYLSTAAIYPFGEGPAGLMP